MKNILFFYRKIHRYAGASLYFTLIAMGTMSLLEGAAILMLLPMLSAAGVVDLDLSSTPLAPLLNSMRLMPGEYLLPAVLIIYMLIVAVQQLLTRKVQLKHAAIQFGFLREVRMKLYESIVRARWEFHLQKRNSDLTHLLLTETAKTSAGTNAFLQLMSQFLFASIQIGIAFWLSPSITVFVLLSGLILLLFSRNFIKKSVKLGQRNFKLGEDYIAGITDHMNGMKEIKTNTLESSRVQWYQGITADMNREQWEFLKLKSTSQMNYKIASAILMGIFIYTALQFFQAQAAQLILIVLIFSRLWPKVTGIQSSFEQIAVMIPSFERVRSMQEDADLQAEKQPSEKNPAALALGLTLEEISFTYKGIGKHALKNISVFFPANQTTAIVGASGAGKSTLIDLLLGLHRPDEGTMKLDEKKLTHDEVMELRHKISYVPQDPYLFQGSIRENLQLVKPHASEEDMWEALRFASAADFIAALPQGLDTLLGDRGVRLSGGERQRLVLARAVLRKTPILILDEATSALDAENEHHIQKALENMRGRMTVIVIAHRLSTIRHADQVIVLEEGKIIQQGGYQKLAHETSGAFHELLQKQQV